MFRLYAMIYIAFHAKVVELNQYQYKLGSLTARMPPANHNYVIVLDRHKPLSFCTPHYG